MRWLVTRPAAQAAEWVAQLRGRGVDAHALPLIGIAPPPDAAAVVAAWRRLGEFALLVFVSPNAAEQFFAARPAGCAWPAGLRAGSPGPGTTRTLLGLGLPADRIVEPAADAPQFDSEALWARLASSSWQGSRVLIVRGEGGREWLAETLRGNGATVETLRAYTRGAPRLDAVEAARLAAARADPGEHGWLFSSSESIDQLALLAPQADWRRAHAIATHPRIAECARAAGFGAVRTSRPALDAVVACIQSIELRSNPSA